MMGADRRAGKMIDRVTPQILGLARRLAETPSDFCGPAFPAIDVLRPPLAALMGNGGFRALLGRALALATAELPWLEPVRVNPDGVLEGLAAPHDQLGRAEFLDGQVVLLAQVVGLLLAFIGPNLTTRLLADIWPHIPLREINSKEDHGETARETG